MTPAGIAHTDPTLEDDQDATRAVDPGTRLLNRLGKLLTWLGGLALAVTIVPVTLIGFFAFGIAANGVEPYGPGLLECRDQDCVTDAWAVFAGSLAYVATVVTVLTMVVRPSRRNLVVISVVGFAVASVLLGILIFGRDAESGFALGAGLVIAVPLMLGLGSALRLKSQPAR